MKIYLAGYMSGACIKKCTEWREKIRNHYDNWKNAGVPYPITWLDPFNGPELESIDKKGLKSSVPPTAIRGGDLMSVRTADIVIANLDTFGQKRPMVGTWFELAWCYMMQKPFVLITNNKDYINHPFLGDAAAFVVKDVDELLNKKIPNYFYKRINGANY